MKKLSVEIGEPEHKETYIVLNDKDVTVYLDKSIIVRKDSVSVSLSNFFGKSIKVKGISY